MALGPATCARPIDAEASAPPSALRRPRRLMARLDETGMRYTLWYAAQQVSGVWSWDRDLEHVEKAFDFAGMGRATASPRH